MHCSPANFDKLDKADYCAHVLRRYALKELYVPAAELGKRVIAWQRRCLTQSSWSSSTALQASISKIGSRCSLGHTTPDVHLIYFVSVMNIVPI